MYKYGMPGNRLEKLLMKMPIEWRYNWCPGNLCACLGCANMAGELTENGFNKEQWEEWVKENPKEYEKSGGF